MRSGWLIKIAKDDGRSLARAVIFLFALHGFLVGFSAGSSALADHSHSALCLSPSDDAAISAERENNPTPDAHMDMACCFSACLKISDGKSLSARPPIVVLAVSEKTDRLPNSAPIAIGDRLAQQHGTRAPPAF